MAGNNGFTPTQRKILDVLSDGQGHSTEELRKCLWDELTDVSTVRVHLTQMRAKLRPIGQDILYRDSMYRHVRLVSISE